jgi:hypothetical protein
MKTNYRYTLTLIASLAIILPLPAFAKDQDQDGKKHGKKEGSGRQRGDQTEQQVQTRTSVSTAAKSRGQDVRVRSGGNDALSGQVRTRQTVNKPATVQRSSAARVAPQNVQRSYRQPNQAQTYSSQRANIRDNNRSGTSVTTQSVQRSSRQLNQTSVRSSRQYNRSNNYGGLWFPANHHRDWNRWDRNRQYYWNHHNYRWYEGGWIIVDAGFWPFTSTTVVYSTSGSIARDVQIRLADQGYYRGPIDGVIGTGSRNAIADYQSDHSLRVTGLINDPLLESLGLE